MILNVALIFYRILWVPLLPAVLIYLYRRGRRDPDYARHMGERFGFYGKPLPQKPVWFHAVSLGEIRSAIALIRLVLDRGNTVVLTHFTPTARRESERLFAAEIAAGQLAVVWVPFDMRWCYRRFFRACGPRIGLPLEVEVWPGMIFAAKRAGIPLFLCNAQYATRPFMRDSKGLRLRQRIVQGVAGAFVKSPAQEDRLASVGVRNISVTGELRFDLPVPENQVMQAEHLKTNLLSDRDIITITSGKEDEERLFANVIHQHLDAPRGETDPRPLFVYVPRAPERFDAVARDLDQAGLAVVRRSQALGPDFDPIARIADADVLVGDSFGEMFFYLALADRVIVGGSFNTRGAHNIIEPLKLAKPILTGPHVWTIEFPFVEAEAAGLAKSVPDTDALLAELSAPIPDLSASVAAFLSQHEGASARTLAEIDRVIN